jgi:hypothetical protein
MSDAALLAYRELDDMLRTTGLSGEMLTDVRTGKNGRYALVGLLRQSVFGRLTGYEDVNDAERHLQAQQIASVHLKSRVHPGNLDVQSWQDRAPRAGPARRITALCRYRANAL